LRTPCGEEISSRHQETRLEKRNELANVTEGRAKEVAKMIVERYKDNAISSSTGINDQNNVIAEVIYNHPSDLHDIIEQVKGNPYVLSKQNTVFS
jgi:hypothetical protein